MFNVWSHKEFSLIFVLFLSSQTLSVYTASIIRILDSTTDSYRFKTKIFDHEISSEVKGSAEDRTKFIDLNLDVLFLILDELSITDWLNFLDTNTMLALLAADYFRRRHYKMEICFAYPNEVKYMLTFVDHTIDKRVEMYDFNLILKTLQQFGCYIQHIAIQNEFYEPDDKLMQITRFINEYGSDSLKHLELNEIDEDTFKHFVVPFTTVESLTFKCDIDKVADHLPLPQLFPTLHRLSIDLHSAMDYSFIDCEFQNLEILEIILTGRARQQIDQMEGLLRKNAHIRNLNLEGFPKDYAKIVNNLLKNVENLTLDTFDIGNDTLHFDHVQQFMLMAYDDITIERLSFEHLDSLQMIYSPKLFDAWTEFFKKHINIGRLYVEVNGNDFSNLVELLSNVPHLIEMEIECFDNIGAEVVSQLIDSHGKLAKFQFLVVMIDTHDFDILRKRFEHEWHIQHIESKERHQMGLAFERMD